jgi:hypothetical protein
MVGTVDNSAALSAVIKQILCPRRQITLLEFTLKYQAEFPYAESQEAERAFTSMICIGAFYWIEQGVFECVPKEEFAPISSNFKKYMKCNDPAKICSWFESLL